MQARFRSLALICAPLLVSGAERIEFAPAPGTEVSKRFSMRAELVLEDLFLDFGGQEIDPSMLGSPTFELAFEYMVVVTDTYGEAVNGRPSIERTIDELETEVNVDGSFMEDDESTVATSPLVGETVTFEWDADEEQYIATSETIDDDVLDGLRPDMDLWFLLPDGGAEPDAEWDVAEGLKPLLDPGGDFALEFEETPEDPMDEEDAQRIEDMLFSLLDEPLEAAYTKVQDDDGSALAIVSLKAELDSSIDIIELFEEMLSEEIDWELEDERPEIERMELLLEAEPEGVLRWDLDEDRFHDLELTVPCIVGFEAAASLESMGAAIEFSVELSGQIEFTAELLP